MEDIEPPANLAEAAPELNAAAYKVCFLIPAELLGSEQEDDDYVDFRVLLGSPSGFGQSGPRGSGRLAARAGAA